jgi:DNA gyrase/topoisomerase IV subunit B
MIVWKCKEQKFQVKGGLEGIREKCVNALNSGGFKKIENNSYLNQLSAKYSRRTVLGKIEITLGENEKGVEINVKSTANSENIFTLFSSPNDKIMNAFSSNLG